MTIVVMSNSCLILSVRRELWNMRGSGCNLDLQVPEEMMSGSTERPRLLSGTPPWRHGWERKRTPSWAAWHEPEWRHHRQILPIHHVPEWRHHRQILPIHHVSEWRHHRQILPIHHVSEWRHHRQILPIHHVPEWRHHRQILPIHHVSFYDSGSMLLW